MKDYIVKKIDGEMTVNDIRWSKVDKVELDYVWADCFPSPYLTEAQLVHSDGGITVRLSTDEWPLTITAMSHNSPVCIDSCMEFFFIPNMDEPDYINLEMNPAGIALLCKGPGRGSRSRIDFCGDGVKIESMIIPQKGWSIMAYIPYSFLLKYYSHCEKTMRANFYKCGDMTVKKHYSAWNPVQTERPDYHRPEYFGILKLSDDRI